MASNRDVTALRKSGHLEDAHVMALDLVEANPHDTWNQSALAWCLIALIKREADSGDMQKMQIYADRLREIPPEPGNQILTEQTVYALELLDPHTRVLRDAGNASKAGRHREAADLYRQVLASVPDRPDIRAKLGWELFHLVNPLCNDKDCEIHHAKRLLVEYLRLNTEKPSPLHSRILSLADRIHGNGQFDFVAFLRYWGLENLTFEDFKPSTGKQGETWPALAEKVIQHAGKRAYSSGRKEDMEYILPYLNEGIKRYPENLWLTFYKAKSLIALGRTGEARTFVLAVTKAKSGDFWTWSMLADLLEAEGDIETAIACYSKALLCPSDPIFLGKTQIGIAKLLARTGQFSQAKHEILKLHDYRKEAGKKIGDELVALMTAPWFAQAERAENPDAFYRGHAARAEELLLQDLPWLDAVAGEAFTRPDKPGRRYRHLYVSLSPSDYPQEFSVSEQQLPRPTPLPGKALKVRGEKDATQRFRIYQIGERTQETEWDICRERIGIVDSVNQEKKLIHFIVARNVDGIVPFSALSEKFQVGDSVSVRLAMFEDKTGKRYRTVTCQHTSATPGTEVMKPFLESVRVSNGLGFTDNDIFLDPSMVQLHEIKDDDVVDGMAVLNLNRKKGTWGWKAIHINKVSSTGEKGQPKIDLSL